MTLYDFIEKHGNLEQKYLLLNDLKTPQEIFISILNLIQQDEIMQKKFYHFQYNNENPNLNEKTFRLFFILAGKVDGIYLKLYKMMAHPLFPEDIFYDLIKDKEYCNCFSHMDNKKYLNYLNIDKSSEADNRLTRIITEGILNNIYNKEELVKISLCSNKNISKLALICLES